RELAGAQAKAWTDGWVREETLGPLYGIPVTLKELIATKGQPVPSGTRSVELKPADADAPAAARLREDGAVIFAKTT
ncbi:amidase family protein, partial [Rhizobium leguminosarum]|uniref:amidase family protein n=1 Tax=Rhizobium leguminosarum TaxID=384 RepID=UPI003F9BFB2F